MDADWPRLAAYGNSFPARKVLPDPRTHDAMAGFLTYRLMLWPPSQNVLVYKGSSSGNVALALG